MIQVGKTYRQGKASLHVLAMRDGSALLESSFEGKVTRYIVASGPYIEKNGELHWGSGHYHTVDRGYGKDETDALREAWIYFLGARYVYVLMVDSEEETRPYLYSTYELALAALQKELDKNQSIQEIAAEILATPLTAELYIDHAAYFNGRMMDVYTIDEMPVMEGNA